MPKHRKKLSVAERVAYHEAGHAVAAYALRVRFSYCSIDPVDFDQTNTKGIVRVARSVVGPLAKIDMNYAPKSSKAESYIQVCLAGAVSEMILLGKYDKGGCQSDLDIANRLAGHLRTCMKSSVLSDN